MATREPRPTQYRIDWHRDPQPDGTPKWWAAMGGMKVAEAVMTGRSGVDDYPWDWYLTDNGVGVQRRGGSMGVADTLRSVKDSVDFALRPTA